MGDEATLASMRRFGVDSPRALGVRIPQLRKLAAAAGRDHRLALALWKTGVHEARILASMVDEPHRVTVSQIKRWAAAFDSWDVTDQVCGNLFDRTPYALDCAVAFSADKREFVKRAGFVLMAEAAVHQKQTPDAAFAALLPLIEREAYDDRNFVKKAVNWALRQIGKRSAPLCKEAIGCAERIGLQDTPPARWIARDALRELTNK